MMNTILKPFCAIVIIALLLMLSVSIQGDEIEMQDGTIYKGTIIRETETTVLIRVQPYGTMPFEKSKLKRITYTNEAKKVESATPTPTLTPSPTPTQTPVATPLEPPVSPPPVMSKDEVTPAPPVAMVTPPQKSPTPAPPPPDIQTGYDAVLFGVLEDVKVRHPGSDWINATEGMQLKVNDEIMTSQGKVKIKLRGRGELRLPPNSYLILKHITPDGGDVTIEMRGGTVWNNVTPGAGLVNYRVQTPDLTAGVRGTLFKVEIAGDKGTRVAVFEGIVETTSSKTEEAIKLDALQAATVNPEGKLSEPIKVDPKEREEWDHWDEWALEVHSIAVRFPIGGQAIDNLAKLHAQDMQRYEGIMNEANQQILTNREEDKVQNLSRAFEKFYVDTGVIPTQEQGFSALVTNPGIPRWNGPYYQGDMPPKDRWGNALNYVVEKSERSGNVYGKVISNGPDGIYSKGSPATDDLSVFVRYYALTPAAPQQQ